MRAMNKYATSTALVEWAGQGHINRPDAVSLDPRLESFGANTRLAIDVTRYGSALTTVYAYATKAVQDADTSRDENVGAVVYADTTTANNKLSFWSGSAWVVDAALAVDVAMRSAFAAFAASLVILDGVPIPGPPGTTAFGDLTGKPNTLSGYGVDLPAEPFTPTGGVATTVRNALERGRRSITMHGASSAASRSDNTTAIQACFDYCRDHGLEWEIPAGDFKCNQVTAYTSGNFTGRIVFPNDLIGSGFQVVPLPADVTTLSAAFVNGLTITRGIDKDAAYSPYYGSVIHLRNRNNASGELPLRYPSGAVQFVETFVVSDPDGSFFPAYENTKEISWVDADTDAQAVKIRDKVVIRNLKILVEDIGAGFLTSIVDIRRPNTIVENGTIISESSFEIYSGFITSQTGLVSFKDCFMQGLHENNTNYGFSANGSCLVDFDNCGEIFCRRGSDQNSSKQITIRGGSYPDGVGGHWVHGLYVSGGAIIASDAPNSAPVFASGSDVSVTGCTIRVRSDQFSLMAIRGDIFECRGSLRCDDNDIELDCTDNLTTPRHLLDINTNTDLFDWGRPVEMPSRISFKGNRVRQIGASFTSVINALRFLPFQPTPPNGIVVGGIIEISENSWKMDAGDGTTTSPRLAIAMYRGTAWQGAGYKIHIADFRNVQFYGLCNATVTVPSDIRSDVTVERVGNLVWQTNFGFFRYADLQPDSMGLALGAGRPGGGLATSIGDEREGFTRLLYGEKAWDPPIVADGAMISTTITVNGAKLGDSARVSMTTMPEAGWILFAQATASNTVTVTAFNKTGGTLDKASGTLRCWVDKSWQV